MIVVSKVEALPFEGAQGESASVLVREAARLWRHGSRPVSGGVAEAVGLAARNPKLRDVRDFPSPGLRPKAGSPAGTVDGRPTSGPSAGPKEGCRQLASGPQSCRRPRSRPSRSHEP